MDINPFTMDVASRRERDANVVSSREFSVLVYIKYCSKHDSDQPIIDKRSNTRRCKGWMRGSSRDNTGIMQRGCGFQERSSN